MSKPGSTQSVAVGYVRVSTSEQGLLGASLEAQREAIEYEAARRGWHLVSIESDVGLSGKAINNRPGLTSALAMLDARNADILVSAKLDRLSRSVMDFAMLLERSRSTGWGLVALDLGVDTTSPAGELLANVMAAVAQWERRAISERTKAGLAVRRAEGVVLGRRRTVSAEVTARIAHSRAEGASYRAIADGLTEDGIPTAHGGQRWWASTVRAVAEQDAHGPNADLTPDALPGSIGSLDAPAGRSARAHSRKAAT